MCGVPRMCACASNETQTKLNWGDEDGHRHSEACCSLARLLAIAFGFVEMCVCTSRMRYLRIAMTVLLLESPSQERTHTGITTVDAFSFNCFCHVWMLKRETDVTVHDSRCVNRVHKHVDQFINENWFRCKRNGRRLQQRRPPMSVNNSIRGRVIGNRSENFACFLWWQIGIFGDCASICQSGNYAANHWHFGNHARKCYYGCPVAVLVRICLCVCVCSRRFFYISMADIFFLTIKIINAYGVYLREVK